MDSWQRYRLSGHLDDESSLVMLIIVGLLMGGFASWMTNPWLTRFIG